MNDRSRLKPSLSFRQLLERVRETCVAAYDNQDLPFPDGVYRLTLLYATVPPSIGREQSVPPPQAVITASFDIIAVLLPPPTCPYPAALQRRPPAL